jgi:hypothetical protein
LTEILQEDSRSLQIMRKKVKIQVLNCQDTVVKNQFILNRKNLKSGLYFCLIKNSIINYNPLKFLVVSKVYNVKLFTSGK